METGPDIGICRHHIAPLAEVAHKKNCFLFIRPTEADSLRLIETRKFPTKSMDIHSKSSNWGPMAGFVPCDPAFSKRPEAERPKVDPIRDPHHQARPVHLELPPDVLSKLVGPKLKAVSSYSSRLKFGTGNQGTLFASGVGLSSHPRLGELYQPISAPRADLAEIHFWIDKADGKVWWLDFNGTTRRPPGVEPQTADVTLRPLWVWGYDRAGKIRPVTGDYDVWAVMPHVSQLGSFAEHGAILAKKDAHGESAASSYYNTLLRDLNQSIGHETLTVFNHGAEAQNYGFTQKHEPNILMIPPSGDPNRVRLLPIQRLADAVAEIEHAGYLTLLNRQWLRKRPKLMGRDLPERLRLMQLLHTKLLERRGIEGRQGARFAHTVMAATAKHKAEQSATLNPARREMAEWYKKLDEALQGTRTNLLTLELQDFPRGYRLANSAMHDLQRELETFATDQMTDGGANNTTEMTRRSAELESKFQTLKSWWSTGKTA